MPTPSANQPSAFKCSHCGEAATIIGSHQRLKVRLFRGDGQGDLALYQHEALQVTLKNGEVYIVDLAGAQYGQIMRQCYP